MQPVIDNNSYGKNNKLYGVRGWLLFIALFLLLAFPLFLIGNMFLFYYLNQIVMNIELEVVFWGIITLFVIILSVLSGVSILSSNPKAIKLSKVFVWIYLAYALGAVIYGAYVSSKITLDSIQSGALMLLESNSFNFVKSIPLPGGLFALGLLFYFDNSKRVANTFPSYLQKRWKNTWWNIFLFLFLILAILSLLVGLITLFRG